MNTINISDNPLEGKFVVTVEIAYADLQGLSPAQAHSWKAALDAQPGDVVSGIGSILGADAVAEVE